MFFRKAATVALRLARDLERPTCRAAMSSSAYRGGFNYLVSAYQPVRLDLSAASSSTLDAAVLSREAAVEPPQETESPLHVGDIVQASEWRESVEGEGRSGNVSLYSSMQSNVPEPYAGGNRSPSHLNMPRGVVGRRQQRRFLSEDRILVSDLNSSVERSND